MNSQTLVLIGALILDAPATLPQTLPPPAPAKEIREGNARFQFLSPNLIRLEYSPEGKFVDAPTTVVAKRDWPSCDITLKHDNGWLFAATKWVALRYRPDSIGFTPENLRISWSQDGLIHSWVPGQQDSLNLGGLPHSLDGARKGRFPEFERGILSRSGYFVLDDSRSPLEDSARQWIVPRSSESSADIYFFVYGRDYRHVLKEYAVLCGSIPMIPRYALGAWATDLNYQFLPESDMVRDYHYSDTDIKEMVERFRHEHIPLDVLVLDFAWHKFGWDGGYDWSPIFPDPEGFLSWAHATGLKVTLNDHPGYGGESVLSDQDSHAGAIRQLLHEPKPGTPTLTIDIVKDWRFKLDSSGVGVARGWFRTDVDDKGWPTIRAGRVWEDQGFSDYDGFAWYRKQVVVPKFNGPLYLIFGGVDDEYDLYVNGTLIAHYGTPGSSVYNTMTSTDISRHVKPGEANLIALRVNDWGGGGGITRAPVEISDVLPGQGIRFNLADKSQATAFMNVLHNPLIDQGVDFWWVDGGSGSCQMNGLVSQLWTNRVFYDFTEHHTGKRALIFSRYGGWGDHRSPMFFTGDTYSEWDVLAEEVPFTARGGNVLAPYITHDIGGFQGRKLDFDLYARWIEFGVFSPVLRLHCAHENPEEGNLRLPWIYGDRGIDFAREMFQLRYRLLPYIYTACRQAYDDALPLIRPLYLEHPALSAAYSHPDEYYFGPDMLVAPIVDATGERDVYLPPGNWVDFFSVQPYHGDQIIHVSCPVDRIPVFIRGGSIIPEEPFVAYSEEHPLDTLIVDIYGPQGGQFRLYEDDGTSLEYRKGRCAWTPLTFEPDKNGGFRFTSGPVEGSFNGQVQLRSMVIRIHGIGSAKSVSLASGGVAVDPQSWSWSQASGR